MRRNIGQPCIEKENPLAAIYLFIYFTDLITEELFCLSTVGVEHTLKTQPERGGKSVNKVVVKPALFMFSANRHHLTVSPSNSCHC